MTDLTKLTAKEFSRRIDNCDWDMEERIENERRLERLEQCEAALLAIQDSERDEIVTEDWLDMVIRLQKAARAALEEK